MKKRVHEKKTGGGGKDGGAIKNQRTFFDLHQRNQSAMSSRLQVPTVGVHIQRIYPGTITLFF